ncbi:unnamed protein product [Pleuronectes platessa]|uniref:Uncharacterized protein n=1 Tax=Pleuronectes platessa TaxID=8262 RepID=A0A9N7V9D0_PLEPL|nr:unnamed protein product [Pleuronectes platessa]
MKLDDRTSKGICVIGVTATSLMMTYQRKTATRRLTTRQTPCFRKDETLLLISPSRFMGADILIGHYKVLHKPPPAVVTATMAGMYPKI